MVKKKSAGILIYRFFNNNLEVLLGHPGGPYWKNKDAGAWSIPKGEFNDDEEAMDAALREAKEEIGLDVIGDLIELSPVKLKSGKLIFAWAVESDFDPALLKSIMFEMEWPPKSGIKQDFPEIDEAAWYNISEALKKINAGQAPLIKELENKLGLG